MLPMLPGEGHDAVEGGCDHRVAETRPGHAGRDGLGDGRIVEAPECDGGGRKSPFLFFRDRVFETLDRLRERNAP